MATDTTAPLAIKAFKEMGGQKVFDPEKFALIIDHAAPSPNERIANLHKLMRDFAREQNSRLFEIGEGICHQVMVEEAYVKPGDIFIGADSHTPTYGALNAFACGVGSTDLAATMMTGKIWLKVPQTIRVICHGKLQEGVTAKDLILFLVGKITVSGATYKAIEFDLIYKLRKWQEAYIKSLSASRLVIKAGPTLGLMGTLIPMGTALSSLSQGDLLIMSANMVTAFTTTIVGMAAGLTAFLMNYKQTEWMQRDLLECEALCEKSLAEWEAAEQGAEKLINS